MDLFYPPTPGLPTFVPKVAYFYDNFNHWNGSLPQDADFPYNPTDSHQGLLTGTAFFDNGMAMVSAAFTDKSGRQVMTAIKKAVNYINDAGVKFINNLENLVKSFTTFPF